MLGQGPRRPLDVKSDLLPESCRQRWCELMAARRSAAHEGATHEVERLFQFGFCFVTSLHLAGLISVSARDELREALISA